MQVEGILKGALTDVCGVFTRVLITVQVLASSQREPVSSEAPGPSASDGSQLLAQHQSPRGHIAVAVVYQHSPSAVLSSERAANSHVCRDDNGHMRGLVINRFKAPLRQLGSKETTSAFVLLIPRSDLGFLNRTFY